MINFFLKNIHFEETYSHNSQDYKSDSCNKSIFEKISTLTYSWNTKITHELWKIISQMSQVWIWIRILWKFLYSIFEVQKPKRITFMDLNCDICNKQFFEEIVNEMKKMKMKFSVLVMRKVLEIRNTNLFIKKQCSCLERKKANQKSWSL